MKKILFCTFFFAGVTFSVNAQPFGKLVKNFPGIESYSFRNSFAKNIPATLDTIKSMGITNIEFAGTYDKTAAEIRKLIDERGLVCTSYGVGYNDLM